MVIKASSRQQVESLIAQLGAADLLTRETAVTRLAVIGGRALDRVSALAASGQAQPRARAGALRVVEAIGDARSVDLVLTLAADADSVVAEAAGGAARAFLQGPRGAEVVDCLTAIAMDVKRPERVRLSSLASLGELGPVTLAPVYRALAADPNARIAEQARTAGAAAAAGGVPPVQAGAHATHPPRSVALPEPSALDGELPDDPAAIAGALAEGGGTLPLLVLHRIVEHSAAREAAAPVQTQDAWLGVRGVAHAALARRHSRLALYDLRETIARAAAPVPAGFLSALRQIGDTDALEAIAAGTAATSDARWRDQLVDVFHDVAAREHVGRRHAVARRIARRWPALAEVLWPVKRTRHREPDPTLPGA